MKEKQQEQEPIILQCSFLWKETWGQTNTSDKTSFCCILGTTICIETALIMCFMRELFCSKNSQLTTRDLPAQPHQEQCCQCTGMYSLRCNYIDYIKIVLKHQFLNLCSHMHSVGRIKYPLILSPP